MGMEDKCPWAAVESGGGSRSSTDCKVKQESWRQNEQPAPRKYGAAWARVEGANAGDI